MGEIIMSIIVVLALVFAIGSFLAASKWTFTAEVEFMHGVYGVMSEWNLTARGVFIAGFRRVLWLGWRTSV